MALPPEKVVLRRKRGAETVEVLLLQNQKRLRTDFQYHLVSNETIPQTSRTASESIVDIPRVPTVRVIQPYEDHINAKHTWQSNDRATKNGYRTASTTPFQDVPFKIQHGPQATIPKSEPRAFYLTTRAPSISLPSPRVHNGIQKRMRKQRNDLAVFAEEKGKEVRNMTIPTTDLDIDMDDPSEPQSDQKPIESDDVVQRKRPGATKEELRWRAKNWNIAKDPIETTDTGVTRSCISAVRLTHTEEYSMKLAEELHLLTMLEAYGEKESLRRPGASPNRTGLKFQPKSLPQRHGGNKGNDVKSEEKLNAETHTGRENSGNDDSGEWCYLTYSRRPNPSQMASSDGTTYVDPLQHLDIEKVGLLVIKPEDEQVWETYVTGGDGDSDKDWNSEEEDENAEDFYGNDYPEEEVDSEDEYGRGAYRLRNSASDDDEYDGNAGSWSDEEVEEPELWKSRP